MDWATIKRKLHDEEITLQVESSLIPFPFNIILRDGLSYNSIKRMSFEEVKANLDNFREVRLYSFLEDRVISYLLNKLLTFRQSN